MIRGKAAEDPEFIALMDDSTFLSNMAVNSESEDIRAAFIARVTRPWMLFFAVAITYESLTVRHEAVQRISDPDILLRVIEDGADPRAPKPPPGWGLHVLPLGFVSMKHGQVLRQCYPLALCL
jgi:hypothetical protein